MAGNGRPSHAHMDGSSTEASPDYAYIGAWQATASTTSYETYIPGSLASHSSAIHSQSSSVPLRNPHAASRSETVQHAQQYAQHYHTVPRHWTYNTLFDSGATYNPSLYHSTQHPHISHHSPLDSVHTHSRYSHSTIPRSNHRTNVPPASSNPPRQSHQSTLSRGMTMWTTTHPLDEPWNAVEAVRKESDYKGFNTKL